MILLFCDGCEVRVWRSGCFRVGEVPVRMSEKGYSWRHIYSLSYEMDAIQRSDNKISVIQCQLLCRESPLQSFRTPCLFFMYRTHIPDPHIS